MTPVGGRHLAARSTYRWIPRGCLGLLLSFGAAQMPAADTERKNFDLPADRAELSVRRFAEQSGAQVVFASASAGKIRTNAVKGLYSAREALDRMVANTPLTVVVHSKTGALMIHNTTEGNSASRAPAPGADPLKKKAIRLTLPQPP